MNKPTSLVFCFTLIFIFIFSSSVNAIPRGIEKRATCTPHLSRCVFQPNNTPTQQIGGEIHFAQFTNCSIYTDGQLNFLPAVLGFPTSVSAYDIHITITPKAADPSAPGAMDLEDLVTPSANLINGPWRNILPPTAFPSDFFTAP
ncbi:11293_t:CDS:1, partial [Ambispora leptoticha]